MMYFIKDNVIHTFPVSRRCGAVRGNLTLRDTVPYGVDECEYCMRRWPEDELYEKQISNE